MSKNKGEDLLSQETRDKVQEFEEKDQQFKAMLHDLLGSNPDLVVKLDNARIERNAALNEAKHLLREDAKTVDIKKAKTLKFGEFTVSKKESTRFLPDMFKQMLVNNGQWDTACSKGVIKTEIDPKQAAEWIKSNKLESIYAGAQNTEACTPAVKGPKEVDPLGA